MSGPHRKVAVPASIRRTGFAGWWSKTTSSISNTIPICKEGRPKSELNTSKTCPRSIVNCIDSPDVPYRFSLNPYRGCSHGCAYWYAPPSVFSFFEAFPPINSNFSGDNCALTLAQSN